MKATLINFTPRPMETAFTAFKNMHNNITGEVEEFESDSQRIKFLEVLAQIPHQTVLEFVSTTWMINGSRAFQQQLTRTRTAAYSIQSLRIVNVSTFASDYNYHMPPTLTEKDQRYFHQSMLEIQEKYNTMIIHGVPVEAARGVLPLNINSPIMMSINLRALIHLMELRMCQNAQSEFRQIAMQMYAEVGNKIDQNFPPLFFKAPCKKLGACSSPSPCALVPGKYKRLIKHNAADIGIVG